MRQVELLDDSGVGVIYSYSADSGPSEVEYVTTKPKVDNSQFSKVCSQSRIDYANNLGLELNLIGKGTYRLLTDHGRNDTTYYDEDENIIASFYDDNIHIIEERVFLYSSKSYTFRHNVKTNRSVLTVNDEVIYDGTTHGCYSYTNMRAIYRGLYRKLSIVRWNLLEREGYSPYCGWGKGCSMPRTIFNGSQFSCPSCDWVSEIDSEFIEEYKQKWNIK